ncbi:MAG: hypothetical protein M1331_03610 [Candidatus Marsarchaeota archaeon]|nr:hypothetical protein [Candidatus Marsarchaeota archaeon]
MELFFVRIASLLAVGVIYMLFDMFNKRNIPSSAVYLLLAYSAALTVLYLNASIIIMSALVAVAVISLGYLIYRIGLIGFGDITELATLSLIFPFFNKPVLYSITQFSIPFAVSVMLNAGFAAIILIPVFYLTKYKIKSRKPILKSVTGKTALKAAMIAAMYSAFIVFLAFSFGMFYQGIEVISVFAVFSIIMLLFERAITDSMVEYVGVGKFEEDELIAMNLLSQQEVTKLRKKLKHFGRLITPALIKEMKQKRFNEKLPIYKAPIPFAAMIFIGLVAAVLFGNILFLVIPGL